MKFGSVCSGIEAASIAWEPLGWSAAWLSEIEPFPCSVLAHHWPDVPNLGDMTTIVPRILSGEVEAPDVFTGGTPCQAFSVAGKRGSLSDDRGNLSLTFCEIANAVDDVRSARGEDAAIIVWENVPGVLSTSDNAFGCFLAGLAGDDQPIEPGPRPEPGRSSAHWTWPKGATEHRAKWPKSGVVVGPRRTVAWRVLDAQYFGLAQRRERVFVVASARNGFNPAAVLFEFDGVRRDSPPSREAGQDVAGTLDARTNGGGFPGTDGACAGHVQPCWWDGGQVSQTLDAVLYKGQTMPEKNRFPAVLMPALSIHENQRAEVTLNDTCGAIKCSGGQPGQGYPAVFAVHGTQDPDIRHDQARTLGRNSGQENAVCVTGEVTHTLKADGFDGSEDGTGRGQSIVATQNATRGKSQNGLGIAFDAPMYTLDQASQHGVATAMRVRRLTPVECERLQGFPDSHTLVPHRGKPAKDGPRYKGIGNSWAVPCARWIGKRIQLALVLGSPSAPDSLL